MEFVVLRCAGYHRNSGHQLVPASSDQGSTSHESMLKVAETIFQTCRTYLIQQGKFLLMLFAFIAMAMIFYFLFLKGETVPTLLLVLLFAVIGMGGSYSVAWYGIRINTFANARTAFASLRGKPWTSLTSAARWHERRSVPHLARTGDDGDHPVVGSTRYCRLLFPRFCHRESLGASALRIAGGIFTKSRHRSDLMKIIFKVKEDDPRNPGVIATAPATMPATASAPPPMDSKPMASPASH